MQSVNLTFRVSEPCQDLDEQGFGLAILSGATIGLSITMRRAATGESHRRAAVQVLGGAGFNAAAARLSTADRHDLYIAGAVGGVSVPVVGLLEKRNPTREALVNTGVGAATNSLQYGLTQRYNGEDITGQELLYNVAGGVGPGLAKATVNRIGVIPKKPIPFDDFTVAAGASFTGGYAIPTSLSLLFGN